jgi:DNA/RNA-binding domain of Phe-tRNA-synthetase-like protein
VTALDVVDYPDLDLRCLRATTQAPLGASASPGWLVELLAVSAPAEVQAPDWVRPTVRDLFRHRGYRPTGRGKPSAEYLRGAAAKGALGPINPAVDCGNAVSLHTGLPISVVDLSRTSGALRVDVPPPGTSYVFNRSGQTIDVGGLLSLFDEVGPCANAVKDAQRTKTDEDSTELLALIWAPSCPQADYPDRAANWLALHLGRVGARVVEAGAR